MKLRSAWTTLICTFLLFGRSPAAEPAATTGKQTIKLVSGDTMTRTVPAHTMTEVVPPLQAALGYSRRD